MNKWTSRKFLSALAGVISGLAMIFGMDESIANTVAGAITAIASVVAYIITEGKIDAAAVCEAAQKAEKAREVLTDDIGTYG